MADIPSSFYTNKLVKPFRPFSESPLPYPSDHTSLLIPVAHFPTLGFLIFFLAYSDPWSFLPVPGCQVPPLKLWSLKAFSFTSHPCTTGHSVPCLNRISLCLWCILWGSDWELSIGLQSGKQMALIYLAISRRLEGHILVTVRPSLIVYGVLKS